jgi:hypothetical protein
MAASSFVIPPRGMAQANQIIATRWEYYLSLSKSSGSKNLSSKLGLTSYKNNVDPTKLPS